MLIRSTNVAFADNYEAMSSSGLIRRNYRMSRNLINKNNLTESTNTAITYSLCCTSVKNTV